GLSSEWKATLYVVEWLFTIIFTVEYVLRLLTVRRPMKYALSFYGIIDLLAILPTYLSLLVVGTNSLMVIRAIRLLRVFRIFKMAGYMNQGEIIVRSLRSSGQKITVFMYFIILMVCIFGAIMYLVEGGRNESFDSIPRSIYWAIVTLTTVGFGDITPQTSVGQFLSAILMIMGYAVIAVPTGIVSTELLRQELRVDQISTQSCTYCAREGHDADAVYCKYCGEQLNED
ncbi:MAG: ion transporter, partial [Bacteroidota bacterium]